MSKPNHAAGCYNRSRGNERVALRLGDCAATLSIRRFVLVHVDTIWHTGDFLWMIGDRGKTQLATERIRREIIDGRFPAGSQLPTFDALTKEHGLSRATMQLVIRQLKEDGFVRSVERSGLFVSERPPHLFRYALTFACSPGEAEWNRFFGALVSESAVVAGRQDGVQLAPFFGLKPGTPSEALDRLMADIAHDRLAGLIVTRGTRFLLEDPSVLERQIPCVAINHLEREAAGFPVVNTDDNLFMAKALQWLSRRRRKRVAIIAMRPNVGATPELCAEYGLATRAHWICPVGRDFSGQVKAVVRLLLDYPARERPDCLIVATDNLVEEALGAVHGTGVVIGKDLDVVAHCNWPWPVESPLPVTRIGFHSHSFLNYSLDAIRTQRQGGNPSSPTLIPALFEHEL